MTAHNSRSEGVWGIPPSASRSAPKGHSVSGSAHRITQTHGSRAVAAGQRALEGL